MNYWGIIKYSLIAILLAIACAVIVPHVHAEDVNVSHVDVIDEVVYPYNPTIERISQGQQVYINDTIDISGQGWGDGVAWYGRYGEYEYPQYIREFTGTKRDVMRFYIDPEIFTTRTGMWYQYYGNATERNGNLRAFEVIAAYRNNTITYANGTVVNQSVFESNTTALVVPKPQILPEVHVSDYLLAIGDPLTINTTNASKVWLFGRVDRLYDMETTYDNITIDAKTFENFEPGDYTLVIQHTGKNTIYEVGYEKGTMEMQPNAAGDFVPVYKNEKLVSPWAKVEPINIHGIQPLLVKDILLKMINDTSDDQCEILHVAIEQPSLTIYRMDEVGVGSRANEFRFDEGLVTLLDVRGYTNMQNGTNISVVLDKKDRTVRDIGRYTAYGTAERNGAGNMSIYQAYVPIRWDNMNIGMHTITAQGPFGSIVHADFPVSVMPADSYRPNATVKYVMDRNPWVPTPTPEVIVKTTIQQVVVERTVQIPVTPAMEVVKKAQDEAMAQTAYTGFAIAILLAVLAAVGYYAWSVVKRARLK